MSQPISSFMERQVWTVDMDDTVAEVESLFARQGLSWAPVLESKRTIMGAISATDLLQLNAQGQDPTAVRAWQRCSYKPIVVSPDTPVGEVARLMIEGKIHHVVVMDGAGIAGVVSSLDFVRTFVRDRRDPGSRAAHCEALPDHAVSGLTGSDGAARSSDP